MNVYFLNDEEGIVEIAACINEYVAERTACLWAAAQPDERYGYGDDEDSVTWVIIDYRGKDTP